MSNEERFRLLEAASIESAHQGTKALLLLNGGSCVAMLGFLASVINARDGLGVDRLQFVNSVIWSLVCFAGGAWLSVLTVLFSYLTNQRYASSLIGDKITWQSGQRMNRIAVRLAILSLVAFAAGVISIICALF